MFPPSINENGTLFSLLSTPLLSKFSAVRRSLLGDRVLPVRRLLRVREGVAVTQVFTVLKFHRSFTSSDAEALVFSRSSYAGSTPSPPALCDGLSFFTSGSLLEADFFFSQCAVPGSSQRFC